MQAAAQFSCFLPILLAICAEFVRLAERKVDS